MIETDRKTYAKRFNAQRAAKRQCGQSAEEGVRFRTYQAPDGGWTFDVIDAAADWDEPAEEQSAPAPIDISTAADPKVANGSRKAAIEAAERGEMPTPPDFTAPTHARFRARLAEVIALAEAGDLSGLRAYPIRPVSSSRKAIDRYRNLCVTALESRAA